MHKHNYRVFDAHLHTYGVFLNRDEDLISYMDRFNVEKAIITTINRTKFHNRQKEAAQREGEISTESMKEFRELVAQGQLDHTDVKDIAKNAPERFYKFFWFNPKITNLADEEKSYKILEDHFKEGFCGIKIHSGFHMIQIPEDVRKLASFMQDFDKKLIFYIHSLPKTSFFEGISPNDIAILAKEFPELRIIVGHAANTMVYAMETGTTLAKYPNIFFETSCSVSFGIYNLIKIVGHNKILFGSDSPTASTLPIEIEKITSLPRISGEVKQDILYNNVNTLLSE
ncbi:MAG: amidohydrolase family protein [Promethearchaeota archaeon]|jgi:predicted TIM-barrel fold metal-dependent hydrolase